MSFQLTSSAINKIIFGRDGGVALKGVLSKVENNTMSTIRKMSEVVFMVVLLYKKFGSNLTFGCRSFFVYSCSRHVLVLGVFQSPNRKTVACHRQRYHPVWQQAARCGIASEYTVGNEETRFVLRFSSSFEVSFWLGPSCWNNSHTIKKPFHYRSFRFWWVVPSVNPVEILCFKLFSRLFSSRSL